MKAEIMMTVMVITRMEVARVTGMVEMTMAMATVRTTGTTELMVTAMNCSSFGNPGVISGPARTA